MPTLTEELLGKALGYLIAALVLVFPIALARWVVTTRWFASRKRIRWAGERPVWWRDQMEELGPLGEEPPSKRRK